VEPPGPQGAQEQVRVSWLLLQASTPMLRLPEAARAREPRSARPVGGPDLGPGESIILETGYDSHSP